MAAACFAAAHLLRDAGRLRAGQNAVLLFAGGGPKFPETVPVDVPPLPGGGRIARRSE